MQDAGCGIRSAGSVENVGSVENAMSELDQAMGPAVAREILKNIYFQRKGSLHATVLIQLGKGGKFQSYIPHLENLVESRKKNN